MTRTMNMAMKKIVVFGLVTCVAASSHAQGLRDPMQMPGSLRAASAPHEPSAPAVLHSTPLHRLEGPLSVLRINGELQLVVGTRLMGVGQMLGGERIERISETEVWLRTGTQTRKLALHEGVQRANTQP